MTVGTMLNEMSATEFAMWMAYAKVEAEKYEKKPATPPDEDNGGGQGLPIPVFEANVKSQMERKGIRARKKKVSA
jgi:hypothetical protein